MKFGSRPSRLEESSPQVRSASRKVSTNPASTVKNYSRAPSCATSIGSFSSTPTAKRYATPLQQRQAGENKINSQSYSRNSTPLRRVDHSSASFSTFFSPSCKRGGSLSSNQGKNAATKPANGAVLRSSVKNPSGFSPALVPDAISAYNNFGAVPQRGFFAPCRCAVSVMATSEAIYSRHEPPKDGPSLPLPALQPLVKTSSTFSDCMVNSSSFPTSPLVEEKQKESKELSGQLWVNSEKGENSAVQVERLRRGTEGIEKPPPLLLSTFMDDDRHSIAASSVISSPSLRDLASRKVRQGSIPKKAGSSYAFSSFPPGRGQGDPLFISHTKVKSAAAAAKVLASYRGQRYQQGLLNCRVDLSECGKSGLHSTLWTASMDGSIEVRSSSSPSILLRVIEPPPPPTQSKSSASPVIISCMKQIGQNHVVAGDTSGYLYVYECSSGALVERIQAHKLAVICMAVTKMPTSSDTTSDSSSASSRGGSVADSNHQWEGGEVAKQAAAHAFQTDGRRKKKRDQAPKPLHLSDSDLCYPRATVLLTGSRDGTIGKWDGVTLECLGRLRSSSKKVGTIAITALCATASGCYAFSGSESGVIRCWSLIENAELKMVRSERKALKKYRKHLSDTKDWPELSPRSMSMISNQSAETACSSQSSRASMSYIMPYPRRKTGIAAKPPSSCIQPPPLHSTKRESGPSTLAKRSHAGHGFDFYYPPSTPPQTREGSKAGGDRKKNSMPSPYRHGKGDEQEKSQGMHSSASYSSLRGNSATPGEKLRKKNASSSSPGAETYGNARRSSCPPFPLSQVPRRKPTTSPSTPRTVSHLRSSSQSFQPLSMTSPVSTPGGVRGAKGGGERGKKPMAATDDAVSVGTRHGSRGNSVVTPLARHPLYARGGSVTPLRSAKKTEKKSAATKKSPSNARNGASGVDGEALYHQFQRTLHAFHVQSPGLPSNVDSRSLSGGLTTSWNEMHAAGSASTTSLMAGDRGAAVSNAHHLNDTEEADPFHFSFPLLTAHEGDITGLEIVEDRVLVSCSRDGTAKAFRLPSGRPLHHFAAFCPRSRAPALTQVYYHPPTSRLYVFSEEGEVAAYNMLSDLFEMVGKPMSGAMPFAPSTSTVLQAEGLHRFALFSVGVDHDSAHGGESPDVPSPSLPLTAGATSSCEEGWLSMVGQMDRNPFVPPHTTNGKKPRKTTVSRSTEAEKTSRAASPPPAMTASSPLWSPFPTAPQETLVGQCTAGEAELVAHLHHLQERYATQRYRMDAAQRAGSVERLEKQELQNDAHRCWRWHMRERMRRYFFRWLRWGMRRVEGRPLRRHVLQELKDSIQAECCRRYFSRWCRWHQEQASHCFESRLRHVTRRVRGGHHATALVPSLSFPMDRDGLPVGYVSDAMTTTTFHGVQADSLPLSMVQRAIIWQRMKACQVLEQQRNQARRRHAYVWWQRVWQERQKKEEVEYHYNRLLLSSFSCLESPAGVALTFLRNKALQPALRQRNFQFLHHREAHHATPLRRYYFHRWLQFRKDARMRRRGGPDWRPHPALLAFRSPTELRSHYFLQWSNFACHQAQEDRLERECRMLQQEWLLLQQLVRHSPSIDALKLTILDEEAERMRIADEKEVLLARQKRGEETHLQLQAQEMLKRFLFGFGAFDVLPMARWSTSRSPGRNTEDLPSTSFPHSEVPEAGESFFTTLPESRPCRPLRSPLVTTPSRMLGGGEVHHPGYLREDMRGEESTRTERDENECRRTFFSMFRALKACVPHFDRDYYRLLSACEAVVQVSQADHTFVGLLPMTGDGGVEEAKRGSGKGRTPRSSMAEVYERGTTGVPNGSRRSSAAAGAEGRPKRNPETSLAALTPSPLLDHAYTSMTDAFEHISEALLGTLDEAGRACGIDPQDPSQFLGVTVDADGPRSTTATPCVEGTGWTALPMGTQEKDLSTEGADREGGRAALHERLASSPFSPPDHEGVRFSPHGEGEEGRGGGPIRIHLSSPSTSASAATRGRWEDKGEREGENGTREARSKEGSGGVAQKGEDHRRRTSHAISSSDRSPFAPSRVPPPFLCADTTVLPSTPLLRSPAPPSSRPSTSHALSSHVRIPWLQLVSSRTRQRAAELLLCLLVLFDGISLKNDDVIFSSGGERVLPWSAMCRVSTAERLMEHSILLFELFYPPLWRQEQSLEQYFASFTPASVGMATIAEADAGDRRDSFTSATLGTLSFPVGNSFLSSSSSTPRPLSVGCVTPPLPLQEMPFTSISPAYMIQNASLTDVDDAMGYAAGWGGHQRSPSTSFSRGITAAAANPYANAAGKGLVASTPGRSTLSAPTTPLRATPQLKIEKLTENDGPAISRVSPVSKLSRELLQDRRRSKPLHDAPDPPLSEAEAFLKVSNPSALSPSAMNQRNFRKASRPSPFLSPEEEQEMWSSASHYPPTRLGQVASSASFVGQSFLNDGRSTTPRSEQSFYAPSFSPARSVSGGARSVSGLQTPSDAFHSPASLDGDDDRRSLMSFVSTTPRGSTVAGNAGGVFHRPFLGFRVQVVRDAGSNSSAIVIKDVVPTFVNISGEEAPGPAAAAGLQSGDQLIRFAHYAVTDLPAFNAVIARHVKPGVQIPVVVLRKNQTISTTLKVAIRLS